MDQIIELKCQHKGLRLRRVESRAEVVGKWRTMVFTTSNLDLTPCLVCDHRR